MKITNSAPSIRALVKARLVAALVTSVAVLAGIGLSSVPASASVPESASSLPVVYGVPFGHTGSNFVHGRVRPTGLLVWTGDGSAWFVIHSYSSWSRSNAWGSATVHVRSCFGSCFRYKTEHTRLHFYRVGTHRGRRYFTRLHFSLKHKVGGLGSGTLQFFSHGSPAWYY
jgi:hypothetical protein